ncbi:MAG TPA: sulfotransferase [Gammaproteobacteria bacterium]|nr:sulfotransferase [Gammaproteobacteria bacterium]
MIIQHHFRRMTSQANILQPPSGCAYRGENLIFVISQPRSGSTLLQRVLAGHPDIQTSAETWIMLHPVYGQRDEGIETEFGARWRRTAVSEFLEHYTDGAHVYDDATRAFAQVIYGNALARAGRTLFLDKTPRYFFIIPDLYRLFPDARFVFLLRNPIAVLASELETYVKGDWPILGLFAPDLRDAPRLILEGIRLLGDAAIQVRYEDFVAEPEAAISRLCRSLRIEFHDSMLDYSATPAPQGTMNDPVGVHRHTRPSSSSLDKWRRLADDAQTRHFALGYLEDLGSEIFAQMGYSFDDTRAALTSGAAPDDEALLFPWNLAITPREQWTARQRFQAERYFAIQSKGRFRGTASVLRRTARRWLKIARAEWNRG